ncbi:MAG: DUF2203 domain-containing protein [Bryobacteraceae bacterium]
MTRHFNLREAEALLEELRPLVAEAVSLHSFCQEADSEIRDATDRIAMLGGASVDRARLLARRAFRDTGLARLRELLEQIQQHGCLVKDLGMGLVDFLTIFRDAEVCLCWRLGEDGIGFWHGVAEGYAGRKRIDEDFLSNHHGDQPA